MAATAGAAGAAGAVSLIGRLPYRDLLGSENCSGVVIASGAFSALGALLVNGVGVLVIMIATTTAIAKPTMRPRIRPSKVPPACLFLHLPSLLILPSSP